MSQILIQQYLNQLRDLRKVSGTTRKSVVREAFKDLLKGYARSHDLTFVPEHEVSAPTRERRYVDGALMHTLRVPFGYWEAKDIRDDIDDAIEKKFRAGYPKSNIIFDNSQWAVLIQHGEEVMRCGVEDTTQLEKLLKLFFGYERPEIEAFRKAVEQFKIDLPAVLEALRAMIERAFKDEARFREAADEFLKHAQEAINPSLTDADVREMLIQHVLTGEVFAAVFPGTTYHEDNSVARELHKLEATFFTGNTKHQTLKGLAPYYTAIRKAAAEIATHHEKQTFLKAIYENFYKVYNPKAADRLGVVYTPNEIVRFMVESADWLCEQHFGRALIDRDVDILDPAAGTGTFICEMLEHFRGQPEKLRQKYLHELHANEVAILPYYVANLNIEATYAAIMENYEEFPGLCFVDTLDNTWGLRKHKGHMDDLFGAVTDENVERIRRQNSKRISVIIGNPPYNANQMNENENNKNREYPEIDKRIKETYIAASTAQKTKLYDMYARFFRWAADRLDENGVLAFITNRSFTESRSFDGFRKCIGDEFDYAYIIDLGGDIRTLSGLDGIFLNEEHTIFGVSAAVGIAISCFVRKKTKRKVPCHIQYIHPCDIRATRAEKLAYLLTHPFTSILFKTVKPDTKHNWINLTDNDFESLIPIATKESKTSRRPSHEKAIFKSFSFGVVTNRDEWVYGENKQEIASRVRFLIDAYNAEVERLGHVHKGANIGALVDMQIKWTRAVKKDLERGVRYVFESHRIVKAMYRPFVERLLYFSPQLNEMPNLMPQYFGTDGHTKNIAVVFTDPTSQKPFMVSAVNRCPDMHLVGAAAGSVVLPLQRQETDRIDNVTDWALEQFRKRYEKAVRAEVSKPGKSRSSFDTSGRTGATITKEAIFHYVYGVLHDPVYREKYALNLKREFPRIPFYADFWQWADWGKTLMDLHIGYESVEPWPLKRIDNPSPSLDKLGTGQASPRKRGEGVVGKAAAPKALLKADKDAGGIRLDTETMLSGIPHAAWDYKLGNRSALEWVLDQYKEKTPKDPTIREKFNTYRFADYKEKVIDLLMRVTRVSVETQWIVEAMRRAPREFS